MKKNIVIFNYLNKIIHSRKILHNWIIVFCLFILLINISNAQNYLISFQAEGAMSSLDSVFVENINQSTSITINGTDILNLIGPSLISRDDTPNLFSNCTPNPMNGDAQISFFSKSTGNVRIYITDIMGREIYKSDNKCNYGVQKFHLTGLKSGMYFFNINGLGYNYSSLIYSTNNDAENISVEQTNYESEIIQHIIPEKNSLDNTKNYIVPMAYNHGDLMRFTGYSGGWPIIIHDTPEESKTVFFTFPEAPEIIVITGQAYLIEARMTKLQTEVYYDNFTQSGPPLYSRGICLSNHGTPDLSDSVYVNDLTFTSRINTHIINNLTPATQYFVRAFATNVYGTFYGNEINFTTLNGIPYVETYATQEITASTALFRGSIDYDGGEPFSSWGFYWSTNPSPTINDSVYIFPYSSVFNRVVSLSKSITGLSPNTTYYLRAFGTNSTDTLWGNEVEFTTLDGIVTLITNNAESITFTSAISGGNILNNGGSPVTSKGICWSINPLPTINDSILIVGNQANSFSGNISNLNPNTEYYIRAFAINNFGIYYGNQVAFSTAFRVCPDTIIDGDGNIYNSVLLGSQCWLNKNLKTTKYSDGSSIPNITNSSEWDNLTTPAYCWYNNDSISNYDVYGALYNWYSTQSLYNNNKNICPQNWHVPSYNEWTLMYGSLGGADVAGGKLKEIGTSHWAAPNTGATDEFGYTALPGGFRSYGSFMEIHNYSYFWSTSLFEDYDLAMCPKFLYNCNGTSAIGSHFQNGASVRCVWDYCNRLPTTAHACNDQLNLINNSIELTGNTPIYGQGFWSIISGTCGYFEDTLNNTSLFTGQYGNSYTLAWNIQSPCGEISRDTVLVSFQPYFVNCGDVFDIDGIYYPTIQIGNQCWLGQNLNTTKFNDGTPISIAQTNLEWSNCTSPALCWYNNLVSNRDTYGIIYNGYVVDTASNGNRNVCPVGWHIPTSSEWDELINYVCGSNVAAAKLKQSGNQLWSNNTVNTNNQSGFTALPGGVRYESSTFYGIRYESWWWSSSFINNYFKTIKMRGITDNIYSMESSLKDGNYIRCIKD